MFEEFLLAEENRKICRKLLICTNRVKDLMLLVFVHDTSHVKQVGDDMKVFFTSGDGAKCHVTSIHIKVMKSKYVYCCRLCVKRTLSHKIHLGHVCAASILNNSVVLYPCDS